MKKIANYLNKNLYGVFLWFLIIINVLAYLAPIFAHIGWDIPAKAIYGLYSFFCHQFDWRSIHFFDYQMGWCTRDTFIWGGMLLVGLVTKKYKIASINLIYILLFILPIALDGGIQTIATMVGFASAEPIYMSTNFMRMATGGLFGIGLGLWMMPTMYDIWLDEIGKKDVRKTLSKKKLVPILYIFLIVIYLLLVQIWKGTSPNNPPANFIDLQVKTPVEVDDWMVRRKNGL